MESRQLLGPNTIHLFETLRFKHIVRKHQTMYPCLIALFTGASGGLDSPQAFDMDVLPCKQVLISKLHNLNYDLFVLLQYTAFKFMVIPGHKLGTA